MIDYQTIKQLAKEHKGISIKDLCALAPSNDPFYTGRPAEISMARWFHRQWQDCGFSSGVHLRRMHYALVSQSPVIERHDGRPYENTQRCWDYLCSAGKYARYLNLVSPDSFVDRRNPEAKVSADLHASWPKANVTTDGSYDVDISLPDCPDAPDYNLSGISDWGVDGQPFMVELWFEKSTMNDVLAPLCQHYNLNLVTGLGELSITAIREFLRRAKRKGRPVRILYGADFDPAGLGMPVSVARKIEFFLSTDPEYQGLDIRLQPVLLTRAQIDEYDLPRVPVKDSDKRKASFEASHGAGQVELDALEALHPGELSRILEEHIKEYFDVDLADRLQETHIEYQERLTEERDGLLDAYPEIGDLQAQYSLLAEKFNEEMKALQDSMKQTWDSFSTDLDSQLAGIESPDIPIADLDDELDDQLYQSDRDYFVQLENYKRWRSGS